MESILQFMYLGEGNFYNERMADFSKVAKVLEGVKLLNMEIVVTEETITEDEERETKKDDEPKQTPENEIWQRKTCNQISIDAKSTDCPECGKEFHNKSTKYAETLQIYT